MVQSIMSSDHRNTPFPLFFQGFLNAFLNFKKLFMYLFLVVLGLCLSIGFSLVAMSRGYSLVVVLGLLIAVISLVTGYKR